jgi:ankyrin repeat protein
MDDGASPLYTACQNGHLDIVEKLLDNVKTDVDTPSFIILSTSVLILSNSFSTMSKCPFWQAIYKGDAP